MKSLLGTLFLLIGLAAHAAAVAGDVEPKGWDDTKVDDIIDDVDAIKTDVNDLIKDIGDIKTEVTGSGNLKVVIDDLKMQLDLIRAQGDLLRRTVEDFFGWLEERRGPFLAFVGSPRCGAGTPCGDFREDLKGFVRGFAATRDDFPVIERLGFGDGTHAVHAIEIAPPMMLFGLHEVLGRMDDWQDLPGDLRQLFDEIGDPEVFSDGLSPFSPEAAGKSLGLFDKTPTQRFCERHHDRLEREIDPVRLNRLKFFVFYIETGLKLAESLTSETIGVTLAGEGNETLIPNPLKAQLKVVISALELIHRGVDTFRANLDICRDKRRKLEFQVAQCIELVDFVKPTKRDEVYHLVVDIVDKAEEEGVSVQNARKSLERAESHREAERWKEAYRSLCDTYQKIGT